MAAKQDVQHSVIANVAGTRDSVVQACRRAAATLGKHADVEENAARVTVAVLPGLSRKFSTVSPVVAIDLRPAGEGRVEVSTSVPRYRTVQSRVMLIPAGPKRLVGREHYFRLLNALETELGAVDPVGGHVRRATPARG